MPKTKAPLDAPTSVGAAYDGPFHVLRERGDSRLLLIGDHASNALPAEYGALGLPAASFSRHIAYDLGIGDLVSAMSEAMAAPAILAGFSRLLIDPNRGEDDPTLVMRLSDGEIIPGNAQIDATEKQRRLEAFHRPYHKRIDGALDAAIAAGIAPLLVSMHSFTPLWRGKVRPWHCGILWSSDRETAEFCLTFLRRAGDLIVGDNQPYSGELEGDSMDSHGRRRQVRHVLIEVRQDLIASSEGRGEWVGRLKPLLEGLMARANVKP